MWKNHSHALATMALALAVCGWFVTWGDWDFFFPEVLGWYYDDLAKSILHGRFDVPPEAILFEAFKFQDKTYGYFGIAPALLRIPLILLFGDLGRLTSRSMMFLAAAGNLICVYGILRALRSGRAAPNRTEKILQAVFVLCCGIGSTNIFLLSHSFVFHEATIWAAMFALACVWSILTYRSKLQHRFVVLAGLSTFLSFHSRATTGAGALLAMCGLAALLVRRVISSRRTNPMTTRTTIVDLVIALAFILGTISSYCAVNYAKFRTFNGIPLQYYQLYVQNPERMKVTGGKQIHPENTLTTVATYFGWRGVRLTSEFPWVALEEKATVVGHPAIDVVEPFSTVPVSMPTLTVLAIVGGVAMIRGKSAEFCAARVPAITMLLGGSIVLMTVGITERYLHDFYPVLVVCAAVGVVDFSGSRRQKTKLAVLIALAVPSIWLNCSFSIVHQRVAIWGVSAEKSEEFVHWQQAFDRLLHPARD